MKNARKDYIDLWYNTKLPDDHPDFESVVGKIFLARKNLLPPSLYRFRKCCEADFDALHNDIIYFNIPQNFNDPYDCLLHIDKKRIKNFFEELRSYNLKEDIIKIRAGSCIPLESLDVINREPVQAFRDRVKNFSIEEVEEILEKAETMDLEALIVQIKQEATQLRQFIEQGYKRDTYLACFSESINSILMWSHYADYHRGFALGYSGEILFSLPNPCHTCNGICSDAYSVALLPVIYGDKRLDGTDRLIEILWHRIYLSTYDGKLPFRSSDYLFSRKMYSTKANSWSYEKEWRLLYTPQNNNYHCRYIRCRPTSIYLGSKISTVHKKILLDLVHGKGLEVFEMHENSNVQSYKLSKRKLRGSS